MPFHSKYRADLDAYIWHEMSSRIKLALLSNILPTFGHLNIKLASERIFLAHVLFNKEDSCPLGFFILFMYLCMYVCMYVSMYVSMYVPMYVCTYVCMYLCMYLCI